MLARLFFTIKKKISNNPYLFLLITSWKYASPAHRRRYTGVYLLFFITYLLGALFPVLYGWFVESVQYDVAHALDNVKLYAGTYVGLTLLIWLFHGPARIMERKLAFDISARFLDDLMDRLVHHPVDWHKNHHSGALINRLRKAHTGLRTFFDNGFMYFQTMVQLIVSMGAIVFFAPLFGSVAVVLGLFSIWVNLKFDKPFIETLDKVNEKEHEVSASLSDTLGNILTVITLRIEGLIRSQLQAKIKLIYPSFRQNAVIGECKWFVANMLVATIYAVIVVGYFYGHYRPGQMFPLGGLVTLIGFVTQFTVAFNSVVLQYSNIVQLYTDVNAANIIGDQYGQKHRRALTAALPESWQRVEIRNLDFSYQKSAENGTGGGARPVVLKGINLKLERGKNIALVGESGVGKSTLLTLLRGLYNPQSEAHVTVDDNRQVDWGAIAEVTTLFPQHPEIFEGTVRFNLTMGLHFEEKEILEACRMACIDHFVAELPQGLNTMIQERGINLSGGQKQRLALVRGLLASKNSVILLLDEPTSGVDKATELKIYRNILASVQDKIIVSTTHNLDLLVFFDRCLMVKEGSVFEVDHALTPVN